MYSGEGLVHVGGQKQPSLYNCNSVMNCASDLRDLFGSAWIGWFCWNGHYSLGLSQYCPLAVVLCVDDSELYDDVERCQGIQFFSLERHTGRRFERRDSAAEDVVPRYRAALEEALRRAAERRRIFAASMAPASLAAIAHQYGCELIANPPELCRWLGDKTNLQAALQQLGLPRIPGTWMRLSESRYSEIARELGTDLVAQLPHGNGGSGTIFLSSEAGYRLAGELFGDSCVWVARDLGQLSVNINALALTSGVIVSCPSVQLEGLAAAGARRGLYCGNDFVSAQDLPSEILEDVSDQTLRLGWWLASLGYRGLFGLDFVIDQATSRAFAVDLNPRWQGSTAPLSLAEQSMGRLPLAVADLASRAGVLGESEIRRNADRFREPVSAAHLCLRCPDSHWSRVDGDLRPAVYDFAVRDEPLRPGCRYSDLENPGEILVTGSAPRRGTLLGPRAHALRFATNQQIFDVASFSLLPWYGQAVTKLWSALALQPVAAE